ncbi:MAG: hypothetical protein OXQ89_24370 [Rhodospirillaceae bacterium]|nr:hypothetical protein [Rhodospirillaceae bacterium]MDE0000883.1 hypothetical protein [Rhodospirillaceae bacterium]MDE0361629.1 hypothetical protein [Rhodospirillaceae bacterium]
MPEPAFDTLEAARGLKSAGIESEHAEAIVEVMGQSVNQLVTREHFDLTVEHFDLTVKRLDEKIERFDEKIERLDEKIASLRTEVHARIDAVKTELHARIDGVESKLQSIEATLRKEIMRAVLMMVGILIPAIGLMMAIVQFYTSRGGGA